MKKLNKKMKSAFAWSVVLASLTLVACGGGDSNSNNDPAKTYKVTVSNVTANQPFSNAAVIIHMPAYHAFQAGQAASVALERLAESGSNRRLLSEASDNAAYVASKSGSSEILPGKSETINVSVPLDANGFKISIASMLVNTNDAFAGVSSNKIADLAVGESFAIHIPVWDSGTEANDESADAIPGPAGGGQGFDASREGDVNFVAIHQGVVTQADGFATSALNESHRFNNPVGLLRVERTE